MSLSAFPKPGRLLVLAALIGLVGLGTAIWIAAEEQVDRRAASNRDAWCADPAEPTPWSDEIPRPCVLPVPAANVDAAVAMLATQPAVSINLKQSQTLLRVKSLNPDSLLDQVAREADAQADEQEKQSRVPFFAGDTANRMKERAIEYRQSAAKARALKGKLKPYLVRGLVLNEGTGCFCAYFRDSTLWVRHDCLGKHAVLMKRRPLIVLLERAPTKVYVSVGMAE